MAGQLIGAGASILTGLLGKGASKKADKAQLAFQQQALGQQQHQFDQTRSDFAPWLSGGGAALGSINDLLGMSGNDAQAAAIAALKGSPGFTSQYNTGVDTILQNSAATGGLRGGNTQNSLAQFGSGLLSQVIQNQLGSLGGLASMGMGAAGSLGSFGQANSEAITKLLAQQGQTTASGILGRGNIANNTINGLAGMAGNIFAPSSAPGLGHGW